MIKSDAVSVGRSMNEKETSSAAEDVSFSDCWRGIAWTTSSSVSK